MQSHLSIMDRTWFHGVDHLLLWLLCVFVFCTLNLAFYEMSSEDKGYFPEDVKIQNRSHKNNNVGAKIFIVFVDGLKMRDIKKIHRSRVLSRVVVEEGVWGEMSLDLPETGFVGLAPFFTGNSEGQGPSVLAAADRVTLIGEPDLFDILKLPRSNRIHIKYPDENSLSEHGEKSHDNVVVNYTIDLAKNDELWDERLKREVVIVHLTALRQFSSKEDLKSIGGAMALDDTLEQLDILFNQLWQRNYLWEVTYFVTSIGAEVPIIAWGRCIDKPRFQDNLLLYQRKLPYSVPTPPRNVDMLSMAPLIACIMGTFPPPNSIGYLPVNFLETIDEETALCQSEIATILKTLYRRQVQHVLKGGWTNLATFDRSEVSQRKLDDLSRRVKVNFQSGDYNAVATFSKMFVKQCQENLHYYRNYKFFILCNITLFMLIGCLLCSFTLICPALSGTENDMDGTSDWLRLPSLKLVPTVDGIFFIGSSVLISTVGMNSFPAWYQVYVTATVLPWWLAVRNAKNVITLIQAVCNQSGRSRRNVMDLVYFILILLTGSFASGQTKRDSLGVLIQVFSQRMNALLYGKDVLEGEESLLMRDLPSVPVLLSESLTDYNILIFVVSMTIIWISEVVSTSSESRVTLWMFSAVPMVASLSYNCPESTVHQWKCLALFLLVSVSWTLTTDDLFVLSNTLVALMIVFGQEELVRWLSWLALGFIPFFGSTKMRTRFVQIFMSLGVPYILITTSGESLNLTVFIVHALIWMIAESYDDLDELAIETIPADIRPMGRNSTELNVRMNYFYNMYALLAGSIVHTDKYEECTPSTGFYGTPERLLNCEFKLALPVLCLTVIHVHVIRRDGGQRYYSLLLTFFYFTFIVFFAFLDVYESSWNDDLKGSHELHVVIRPMSVWFAVLACSWIADLLLCPPIIHRQPPSPEIPM